MNVTKYKSAKFKKWMWRYDFTDHNGKRFRPGGFATQSDAERALSLRSVRDHKEKHGLIVPAEELPTITFKQLIKRRLNQRRAEGRNRKNEEHALNRFLASLPDDLLVTQLADHHFYDYQTARLKVVAPQTLFRELTDVFSMLNNAAVLDPKLKDWKPPRRPKLKVPSGQRTRVITRAEAAALLRYMRRPYSDVKWNEWENGRARFDAADHLQIALQTGARSTEIRLLKWTDFNAEFRTLTRRQWKKGNQPLVVPLSAPLVARINERRARQREQKIVSEWMFPSPRDSRRPLSTIDTRHIKDACKECKIPYGRYTDGGMTTHDSRHTVVTSILEQTGDIAAAQAFSGHSSKTMLMRYAHATGRGTRRAVAAVEGYGETPDEAPNEREESKTA